MAQRILRLTFNGNNDRRFADPANFSHTFRTTLGLQSKNAGDSKVTNARSEFVTNDIISVAEGRTDPCLTKPRQEKVSVRTIVSGSVENQAVMVQLVKDHLHNVNIALADQLSGFISDGKFVVGHETA